jgi:LacI family transcriptional regulator
MARKIRIAVALQSWQQYSEAPVLGAARFAQEVGRLDLVDVPFHDDGDVPRQVNRIRPDGVITQLGERMYNVIGQDFFKMLPLVNVGADLHARGIPSVTTDQAAIVRIVTEHLAGAGYQNFGVVMPIPSAGSELLIKAFCAAMGQPETGSTVHRMLWPGDDLAHDPGPDPALQKWLSDLSKPVGIFVRYGYQALWITQECERLGLKIPDDVGIISALDENVCLFAKPAITSVRLAGQQLGYEAMRMLHGLLRKPAKRPPLVTIKPEGIVQRASTGPVVHEGEDILRALRFIQQHATQGIRVPDVLRHTQTISRSSFYSLFVHRVGCSPAEKIRLVKIDRAKWHLKETELSITQISSLCGFNSIKQFSEAFHKEVGQTARQFRKEQRK